MLRTFSCRLGTHGKRRKFVTAMTLSGWWPVVCVVNTPSTPAVPCSNTVVSPSALACTIYRANEQMRRCGQTALGYAQHGRADFSLRHLVFTTPYQLDDPGHAEAYVRVWDAVPKALTKVVREQLRDERSDQERNRENSAWPAHHVGYLAAADWGDEGAKLHIHLLYYGPYLDQALLRDSWGRWTDGEAEVVWLDAIRPSQTAVDNAITYTCKLSPVPAGLTPELLRLLQGGRRIRSRGIFMGIQTPSRRVQTTCRHCGAALQVVPADQEPYLPLQPYQPMPTSLS